MAHTYEYPRAALTVDCVVIGEAGAGETPHVLLIRRGRPPFEGAWALPGGFLEMDETLEQGALRELREETGLTLDRAEQLGAFDAVARDPRERVISVAHVAFTRVDAQPIAAADDAREVRWFSLDALPELAFDHAEIIGAARTRLREGDVR